MVVLVVLVVLVALVQVLLAVLVLVLAVLVVIVDLDLFLRYMILARNSKYMMGMQHITKYMMDTLYHHLAQVLVLLVAQVHLVPHLVALAP